MDKLWPVGGALGRVVGAVGKVLGWPEEEPAAAFCEAGGSPGLCHGLCEEGGWLAGVADPLLNESLSLAGLGPRGEGRCAEPCWGICCWLLDVVVEEPLVATCPGLGGCWRC